MDIKQPSDGFDWPQLYHRLFFRQPDEDDDEEGHNVGGDLVRKEMYLVKWKNLSYLHNSWEMASHLEVR